MPKQTVAEAEVKITADTKGLDEGVKRADRKVDSFAKRAKKRLSEAGGAAERLQAVLGRLLIPLSVVTGVAALAAQFRALVESGREFKSSLDGIIESLEKQAQAANRAAKIDDASTVSQIELNEQLREQQDQLVEQLEERIQGMSLLEQAGRKLISGFVASPVSVSDFVKEAERASKAAEARGNELRALAKRAAETKRQAEADAKREADLSRIAALEERIADLQIGQLDGVERIRAEWSRTLDDIAKRIEESDSRRERQLLSQLAGLTNEDYKARIQQEDQIAVRREQLAAEQHQRDLEREREKAREYARQQAESLRQFEQDAIGNNRGVFPGAEIVASIEGLRDDVRQSGMNNRVFG